MKEIQSKPNFWTRWKTRWNVESNLQMWLIITVFAITGSTSVKVARPIMEFLGINSDTMSPFAYYPLRIIIVLPVYQILLIIIGTIFGQFKFFWAFEKKMLGRFVRKK